MDLFGEQRRANRNQVEPLAVRMRPRTLDEFVGQTHFIGKGKLLRRTLEADRMTSTLLHGPAGTGKTTLAAIIAERTKAHFVRINAAQSGAKELKAVLQTARDRLETAGQRTILFIDELHRFNRAQQDILLDDVENGTVILVGATTENPFYVINSPLVSRSQIFRFEPLSIEDIRTILDRALRDREKGLGRHEIQLTDQAANHLAVASDGDARRALTALEIAALSQIQHKDGSNEAIVIDLKTAEDSIQRKAIAYDRSGDLHYDNISAMIKSIRGGDPDATVYWLARMLEAGEDPRFLARRLVISAAEDIGNADPKGLILAQAAADATHLIGMPECQIPLAQAAIYLSCAPKSRASAEAIFQASKDVRNGRTLPVPRELRSGAHAYTGEERNSNQSGSSTERPHGTEALYFGVDKVYYTPKGEGAEATLRRYIERFRQKQRGNGSKLQP